MQRTLMSARWAHAAGIMLLSMACAEPDRTPAFIEPVGPVTFSGIVGAPLDAPPQVRVLNAGSRPLSGVPVVFETSDNGTVRQAHQVTDANGLAAPAAWQLGVRAGDQTLTARVPAGPATTFVATAAPRPATRLALVGPFSQHVQNRVPFALQPGIGLADIYGNSVRVPGVVVTVRLTGAVGSPPFLHGDSVAVTDANGVAVFHGLYTSVRSVYGGGTAGRTLEFSAPGFSDERVTIFPAAGPPARLTKISPDSLESLVGTAVEPPPAVHVVDEDDNPLRSPPITFTVSSGGGVIEQVVFGFNTGIVTGHWRLGAAPGTHTVTVSAGTAPPVAFTAFATSP